MTVPESLRNTRDLQFLDIGNNQIRDIPSWIGELESLRTVTLSSNALRSLPPEIGTLKQLRLLWIEDNDLQRLPESLRQLPLQELRLHDNPGLDLPPNVVNKSPREILSYYFAADAENDRALCELKLLLVGRGKAGKTTLLKRLVDEPPDDQQAETHSIDIRELTLECAGGSVRTRAWDFAGQEILHAMHQFFMTARSLYLVVLEPLTTFAQQDAEYWLKLIETRGGGSPAIVVLNFSHERPWRVDVMKLRRKFPFIVDFVPTDALKGDGIEDLRRAIVKTIEERIPQVWRPFPRRWRNIKDAVAGMGGNFLTYRQYADLCEQYGEPSSDAQAELAGILHTLGLALYFGNDPRLRETSVLNPAWVTGGVYAVLRSPSIAKDDGRIRVHDMPRVLLEAEARQVITASDYPRPTHTFILELMRAFRLCSVIQERNGKPIRFLVHELLPEDEPETDERWDTAPTRLRYRYDVLPPGLLSRFIAPPHVLNEGAPRWRHGIILLHAQAKALIREEVDPPQLNIFVLGGDDETRRVLAAMVRGELEVFHAEMHLQPREELRLTGDSDHWIGVKALEDLEKTGQSMRRMPVQPEGVAEVFVSRELNKLLPAEVRAIDRDPTAAPAPVRLFVCYARADEDQLERLDMLLKGLEREHKLAPWRDNRLIAGDEWDAVIRERLEEMDIFLFIASQRSLVSDYINDVELARAKQRRDAGEIEFVTIKLEACGSDDHTFLGKFQRLARRFKSVSETSAKPTVWEQVRKDLLPVIERVRQKKALVRNPV